MLPVVDTVAASCVAELAATPVVSVLCELAAVAVVDTKLKYNETSVLVPKTSTPPVLVPMAIVLVGVQRDRNWFSPSVAVAAPQ